MEFQEFRKIPRLSRDMVITEKLDGSNGQITIFSQSYFDNYIQTGCPDGICSSDYTDRKYKIQAFIDNYCLYKNTNIYLFAGSKSRWLDISSKGDNYGFAKWVQSNAEELLTLGEGRHYGEWFGKGIQRNYGLDEKRFALFNVGKWIPNNNVTDLTNTKRVPCPTCCTVVPVLYYGLFDTLYIESTLDYLKMCGSFAVPGFMKPEGIIVYHTASGTMFKKTLEGDEKPKSLKEGDS